MNKTYWVIMKQRQGPFVYEAKPHHIALSKEAADQRVAKLNESAVSNIYWHEKVKGDC